LHGEVGEAVPEPFSASLDILPSTHQTFSAFVKVELRHIRDVLRLLILTVNDVVAVDTALQTEEAGMDWGRRRECCASAWL
jgi:hypothetical protein